MHGLLAGLRCYHHTQPHPRIRRRYCLPSTADSQRHALWSQNDPGGFGNFATMYDDFVIFPPVPFYLNDMPWYRIYSNPAARGHITGATNLDLCGRGTRAWSVALDRALGNDTFESFMGNFGGYLFYAYHEDDNGGRFTVELTSDGLDVVGLASVLRRRFGR